MDGAGGVRHRVEYWAVRVVTAFVRLLPLPLVRPAGTLLGLTFYALDPVHRRVADTNLKMAFPQRTDAERRRITREMFGHFGCVLFELLKFSTMSRDRMRAVVEFDGEDRARAAYAPKGSCSVEPAPGAYTKVHVQAFGVVRSAPTAPLPATSIRSVVSAMAATGSPGCARPPVRRSPAARRPAASIPNAPSPRWRSRSPTGTPR